MHSAEMIKRIFQEAGADLCGIASIDRFAAAPKGYHPTDVMPGCRSVISFACRFPAGALACTSHIPYTRVRNSITPKMDAIALEACMALDGLGILAAPIPTNESQWDEATGRWRSIVSQKHAAQAAGLGTIGRHTLLMTPQYGALVWLGAVLTDAALEPDPLLPSLCDGCGRCVAACPVHALDGEQIAQQTCWDYAFGDDPKTQAWRISCHCCRDACPHLLGEKNDCFRERLTAFAERQD